MRSSVTALALLGGLALARGAAVASMAQHLLEQPPNINGLWVDPNAVDTSAAELSVEVAGPGADQLDVKLNVKFDEGHEPFLSQPGHVTIPDDCLNVEFSQPEMPLKDDFIALRTSFGYCSKVERPECYGLTAMLINLTDVDTFTSESTEVITTGFQGRVCFPGWKLKAWAWPHTGLTSEFRYFSTDKSKWSRSMPFLTVAEEHFSIKTTGNDPGDGTAFSQNSGNPVQVVFKRPKSPIPPNTEWIAFVERNTINNYHSTQELTDDLDASEANQDKGYWQYLNVSASIGYAPNVVFDETTGEGTVTIPANKLPILSAEGTAYELFYFQDEVGLLAKMPGFFFHSSFEADPNVFVTASELEYGSSLVVTWEGLTDSYSSGPNYEDDAIYLYRNGAEYGDQCLYYPQANGASDGEQTCFYTNALNVRIGDSALRSSCTASHGTDYTCWKFTFPSSSINRMASSSTYSLRVFESGTTPKSTNSNNDKWLLRILPVQIQWSA